MTISMRLRSFVQPLRSQKCECRRTPAAPRDGNPSRDQVCEDGDIEACRRARVLHERTALCDEDVTLTRERCSNIFSDRTFDTGDSESPVFVQHSRQRLRGCRAPIKINDGPLSTTPYTTTRPITFSTISPTPSAGHESNLNLR